MTSQAGTTNQLAVEWFC